MPKFVFVPSEYEPWLKKAIDFAKRIEGPLLTGTASGAAGAIMGYLLKNNIPHDSTDNRNRIPAGHHYSEHD